MRLTQTSWGGSFQDHLQYSPIFVNHMRLKAIKKGSNVIGSYQSFPQISPFLVEIFWKSEFFYVFCRYQLVLRVVEPVLKYPRIWLYLENPPTNSILRRRHLFNEYFDRSPINQQKQIIYMAFIYRKSMIVGKVQIQS